MEMNIDLNKYKSLYHQFVEKKELLSLSFVDENGEPFISCTPFVEYNGKFYIYISEIAEHFELMKANKTVDALIIADQSETKNRFATERARWSCSTKLIGNEDSEHIFRLFNERFGEKMIQTLRNMDFSLFELTPTNGRYVVGFGLAFNTNLDGSNFSHLYREHKTRTVDKNNDL